MINQKIFTLCLKKFYNIEIANNGKEAIDKLLYNNYDLILMDEAMPVINGVNTVKLIRKLDDKEKSNIPIIGNSGGAGFDKDKWFIAGANDFISKPMQAEVLITKIKKLLKE